MCYSEIFPKIYRYFINKNINNDADLNKIITIMYYAISIDETQLPIKFVKKVFGLKLKVIGVIMSLIMVVVTLDSDRVAFFLYTIYQFLLNNIYYA